MSFGSVAYARTDQIHRTDLTLKELGKATGAWEGIVGSLATLHAAGSAQWL